MKEAGASRPEGRSAGRAARRGRFIAFEGIDGSGKSTALAHVAQALRADGHHVLQTREETVGPTGEWVRRSIREGMDPLATAFLFLADRAQHVQELRGALEAGTDVLCDRYSMSTLAYQGTTLAGRVAEPIAFLRALHAPIGLEPDHVLLFRVDVQEAVARARRRGEAAPYEKEAFLATVQHAYLDLAAGDPRVHVLDADREPEAVAADAVRMVRGWL